MTFQNAKIATLCKEVAPDKSPQFFFTRCGGGKKILNHIPHRTDLPLLEKFCGSSHAGGVFSLSSDPGEFSGSSTFEYGEFALLAGELRLLVGALALLPSRCRLRFSLFDRGDQLLVEVT